MAIVYEDAKWGDGTFGTSGGTVTYAFATATSATQIDYDAQLNAEYQAAVIAALDEWSDYADIEFVQTYDVESANITFGWDSIDTLGLTLAEAQYSYNPRTDQFLWAEIRFDTAENWAPTNAETDPSEISFYAVALHEIGHAIGLDHSTGTDSIMTAYYGAQLDLTPTDIAGIQALYGAAAPEAPSAITDLGGYNYGWSQSGGGLAWGWHTEIGWDYGWYSAPQGWSFGWFFHAGWEFGWYDTGSWIFGWYYDYGGTGFGGTAYGWQDYGWYGGDFGHEGWGWTPPPGWYFGDSYDYAGWNYGWSQTGGWGYGWHLETGWDYGWYETSLGWGVGWYIHQGWEYGWFGTGSWTYGWFYDYGGAGSGWNIGWEAYGWYGGLTGSEEPWYPSWFYGDSADGGGWNYGWSKSGGWGYGWHLESGWDRGWYGTSIGWDYGWYIHQGWEYGWYGTGSWTYGWYYDYGGAGVGWDIGWQAYGWDGGLTGNESFL